MKVLIIGGVAGGASAAARLRRLCEDAEIIMFERGEHISFANCGLPYYIGQKIKDREKLLVQTPAGMGARFNLDIRIKSEVVKIDREKKQVEVRDHIKQENYLESYDYLLLSPGAEPIVPPIPGLEKANAFSLRSLEDTDRIVSVLKGSDMKEAVIVGGGFIGLEMAENLAHIGINVQIVEASSQVMGPLDPEMANIVHRHLKEKGVGLYLNNGVAAFDIKEGKTMIRLADDQVIETDAVILAIGVRPDTRLASDSGLELGARGTIKVNERLQTSDPGIYAVGDAIEVVDFVNGGAAYIPLAGPANRQGRIAADNIAGRSQTYKGTQGTSIAKVFDLTVACTGNNEKTLSRLKIKYKKSYTNSASHAGYYPGAIPMNLKLLFDQEGKILGAQIVGVKGVDKRIDVLATAIRAGLTVYDLEELELAYAPPFSSAKDPVNVAGFVAANILKEDVQVIHWHEIAARDVDTSFLLDTSTREEYEKGHIEGAVNIPLHELRKRINEIPVGKEIIIYCKSGLRSYIGSRILKQKGFKSVKNLSGGYNIYSIALLSEG